MTMFLIQALLWLLVAFLLGYGIGRFLKSLFCHKEVEDRHSYELNKPGTGAGSVHTPQAGVTTTTAKVLGGAAAAASAVAVARNKLAEAELPDISREAPKFDADLPDVDVKAPEVDIELPDAEVRAPKVDTKLPDVEVKAPELDVELPDSEIKAPELNVELPDLELKAPEVDVQLPKVEAGDGIDLRDIAKGAVTAAGTGLVAKAASAMEFERIDPRAPVGIDPHMPNVDPPGLDVDPPVASLLAPSVDFELPKVEVKASEVGVELPDANVTAPAVDVALPEPDVELPDLEVKAPEVDLELPNADLKTPEMDVELSDASFETGQLAAGMPEANTDKGIDLLEAAGMAVTAGGAVLAMAADDVLDRVDETDDGTPTDKETNWLLPLVEKVKDAYQGRNPRAVSRLWDVDSGYNCSSIEQYESLTLRPAQYDKLGCSHCGVPRAGFIAVGGDVSDIEPGTAVLFHYPNIVACRDADGDHHFIRVTG
ncbi:MAG: hypothetical protein ACFCUG_12240 [Thiotrichales bacterium]